jgi:NAD dependent epimerase/dehydratase
MKKVLVTGADGFIGSHLVELLVANNYSVKALSQYNSFNNWGWLEDISCQQDIEILSGDVRDANFCNNLVKDVDLIFHLAALIAIPYSYQAVESYIETNIKGTINICQAAINNNVSKIIHTSTSEVYGTAIYVPIDENHPLQPQSPYSASKISADAMAMSFYNAFDLPLVIARPFNTFGPRQSARAIIPTIITQIASGSEKIKLGDLSPTRDFTYVDDTCRGLLSLSESKKLIGETLNIGSNREISIGDLANLIKKIMKSEIEIINVKERNRAEKSEVFRLYSDISKLQSFTGYEPSMSLEEGLSKTIDWFLDESNLNKYKSGIYNV